jgi:hypothetical protein
MKSVLALTLLATLFSATQAGDAADYHYVAKGFWGKWKTYKSCPENQALCGFKQRIEKYKGKFRDDTAGNGVYFKCCDIDEEKWAMNQTEIKPYKGKWGTWRDYQMCNNGTYIVDMDAKMDPKSAVDDTAMGGLHIVCDSITKPDMLNANGTIESKWGSWVNDKSNTTENAVAKVLYCGASVRFEGKQGLYGDDSAMNGLRLGKCHNFIRRLSGRWDLKVSAPHGDPALSYMLETKVMSTEANTKQFTTTKEWSLTTSASLNFDIY